MSLKTKWRDYRKKIQDKKDCKKGEIKLIEKETKLARSILVGLINEINVQVVNAICKKMKIDDRRRYKPYEFQDNFITVKNTINTDDIMQAFLDARKYMEDYNTEHERITKEERTLNAELHIKIIESEKHEARVKLLEGKLTTILESSGVGAIVGKTLIKELVNKGLECQKS